MTDIHSFLQSLRRHNQPFDQPDVLATVKSIQEMVIQSKDQAVIELTQKFDKASLTSETLRVTEAEIKTAYEKIDSELLNALKTAHHNIQTFHQHQFPQNGSYSVDGIESGIQFTSLDSAGLYVPGGTAIYPTSVLMNAIPAQIAGVSSRVMVTPPQPDGSIHPALLVAADLCDVHHIFKVGGAQAVFALTYGTETIPQVDKIVGPGNIYVTAAKQLVYGIVDIDKPAGPSEVLVYVDSENYASYAASECLAQLEHDPRSVAIAICSSEDIGLALNKEFNSLINQCQRQHILSKSKDNGAYLVTHSLEDAIDQINAIASEHLVLLSDDHDMIRSKVKHAGSIFCGPYTPVTLGDYVAGPNHVLPTTGAARFSSPLGVHDFMKYSSYLTYSKAALKEIQPTVNTLTKTEGLDAHQLAVDIRLK